MTRFVLCALLLALPATAQRPTPTPAPAATPATPTDTAFKAIYTSEATWQRKQRGDQSPDDERRGRVQSHLPKVDAATQQARLDFYTGLLKQLDDLDPHQLSPSEHLNYEVYRAQVVVTINAQKFREYEKPANSDTAFWSDLGGSGDDGFKSEAEYQSYIARLNDLPRYFNEQIVNMRAGLARGFTPPRVTLNGRDATIRPTAEAKSPETTDYYKPFLKMPDSIPADVQSKLRKQGSDAIRDSVQPAFRTLLKFWTEDYVPHAATALAAESLPDGKAYYQAQILEYATTTQTPAEIHQLGLDEMAKIHAEMLATMKQTGFTGDLPAFLQYLRTDPRFYAKTPEELLMRAAFIAKDFDGVAGRYFGYLPRQRFGIKPVPDAIAPFYTSARGGANVYWVNTYDLPSRGLYSLVALTLHESAPGHSLQLSIAQEHRDLPRFRNAYISAYGEGWALYCERLGTEMGLYHTPYDTFGMLSYQAWRAARLVVDTGIHSQGWTREQAQKYLHDNTALSDHEIETEVDRYISWPGQAVSYYLGELAILKARHKAEAALGPKFNLRAFHDAILATGAVPLPVLEENIDDFIAKGGVGPYPDMER
jgi:uncharacterized protein (DUF885 family)